MDIINVSATNQMVGPMQYNVPVRFLNEIISIEKFLQPTENKDEYILNNLKNCPLSRILLL